jgi:hypothetical protein
MRQKETFTLYRNNTYMLKLYSLPKDAISGP